MASFLETLVNIFATNDSDKMSDQRAASLMKITQREIPTNKKAMDHWNREIERLNKRQARHILEDRAPNRVLQGKVAHAYESRNLAQDRLMGYERGLDKLNQHFARKGAENGMVWVKAYKRADGTVVKGFYRNM